MPQDYSGQNLRGRSFRGKNLEFANFSGANIRGANFTDAKLQGANFSGADIRGVNFENAQLRGSDFTNAKAGLKELWVIFLVIICFGVFFLSGITYTRYCRRQSSSSKSRGLSLNFSFQSVITIKKRS